MARRTRGRTRARILMLTLLKAGSGDPGAA